MYKTMNGWTKDDMIAHILVNFKGKSVNKGQCVYRGPEGKKCAVGMFIPDEKYSPKMEKCNSEEGLSNLAHDVIFNFKLEKYMPIHPKGLLGLQEAHDSGYEVWNNDDDDCLSDMILWIEDNVEDGPEIRKANDNGKE